MTPWQWWAVPECCHSDGEWSIGECETREKIIAAANRELRPGTPFFIIEARSSTDARYADGNHELVPFKRTRNEERLIASVDRSPEGEKPQALNAKHESAVGAAETPTPDHLHHSSTTPGEER